jgi:hypothetical protein
VFEGVNGDNATLQLRRKNADGTYSTFPFQFPIRKDGKPLYTRHPTADVAAMYADIPDEVPMTGACPQFNQMTAAAKWIAARKFRAVLS